MRWRPEGLMHGHEQMNEEATVMETERPACRLAIGYAEPCDVGNMQSCDRIC